MKKTILFLGLMILMIGSVMAVTEQFEDDTLESFLTEYDSGLTVNYTGNTVNISGASAGTDYHFFKWTDTSIDKQIITTVNSSMHSGTLGVGVVLIGNNYTPSSAVTGFTNLIFSVSGVTSDDFAIYFHNSSSGDIFCWDKDTSSWVDIDFYSFTGSACDGDTNYSMGNMYITSIESNGTHTRGKIQDEAGTTLVMSGWADNDWFDTNPTIYSYFVGEGDTDTYYTNYEVDYITLCEPNWTCSEYSSCNVSDLMTCTNVTDLNSCGVEYTGDYSEFTTSCNYCTLQYHYETTEEADCDGDTETYTKYAVYDNYDSCCALTNLSSDCDLPANESVGCDYYVGIHDSSDISGMVVDFGVEMGINYIAFAGLIALGSLGIIAFRRLR